MRSKSFAQRIAIASISVFAFSWPAQAQLYGEAQTREIAAIINSVACAAKNGSIPRSQMGARMKSMFAAKGYSSQRIYDNWSFYYRNAKFLGSQAGLNCLN
jgi:hypothetical protein